MVFLLPQTMARLSLITVVAVNIILNTFYYLSKPVMVKIVCELLEKKLEAMEHIDLSKKKLSQLISNLQTLID